MSTRTSEIELLSIQIPDAAVDRTTSAVHSALPPKSGLRSTSEQTSRISAGSVPHRNGADSASIRAFEPTTSTVTSSTVTSASRATAIIVSVTFVTVISSLINGLTTVALPTIARELNIPQALLLWPSSIQALTTGCSLLLSGSIADAIGARFMYLAGCVLQVAFALGCGLSRSTTQIILFRGLSGIGVSFCLPSAVAIVTKSFVGRRRNIAFASMGGGQPIGFATGLTVGGVLTDTISWRWGFYLCAILDGVLLMVAVWVLPRSIDRSFDDDGNEEQSGSWKQKWSRMKNEIDWIGALIISTSLAMLSYVFATTTGSAAAIRQPASIALLVTAFLLVVAFVGWVGRQEKMGRPALIPNSLWRSRVFTVVCAAVFLVWGSFNAVELLLTFFFQDVQELSATQASIRFLPEPVSGLLANIMIALAVHRVRADLILLITCIIGLAAPLVMIPAKPWTSYWFSAFWATLANPLGADSLFTIANLLITSSFAAKTQGLAGGVFNTIAQIGKSVGLFAAAVVAADVTARSGSSKQSPEALLQGYRASFWLCFGLIVVTCIITGWGLRKIGKVGHKED